MTGRALNMHQTAEFSGVAYDTFRKQWEGWVVTQGFPRPFRDVRPYAWDEDDLVGWRERRKKGGLPAAANDRGPVHPADRPAMTRAVAQQRAAMIARMTRGACS